VNKLIRIAVVDDINAICSTMEKYLSISAARVGVETDISVYYGAQRLCEDMYNGVEFDLLFMDIELGDMNGIEAVRFIREELRNESMRIVFISGKTEYANELFEHDVMNFLKKPITFEKIDTVLNKYLRVYHNDSRFFSFEYKNTFHRLNYNDIVFFESDKRVIKVHTIDNTYSFYEKMDQLSEQIHDTRFFRIHQSYIINMMYVKTFRSDSVVMKNGAVLSVSRPNREALAQRQIDMELGVM